MSAQRCELGPLYKNILEDVKKFFMQNMKLVFYNVPFIF
jgi:hypothetical protein